MAKRNNVFLAPMTLSMLAAAVLLSPRAVAQDAETPIIPVFPTGCFAVFADPIKATPSAGSGVKQVYIRSDSAGDARVWIVPAQDVPLISVASPASRSGAATEEQGIGFFVPQLSKGIYLAWFDSPSSHVPGQSIKLVIQPRLFAAEGIRRSSPNSDIEIRVRIYSPVVTRQAAAKPDPVRVSVKLESSNAAVADLQQGQPAIVTTDDQGYARWKVHINSAGIASFVASAKDFESAIMDVVGMPRSAPTFNDAEVMLAREEAEAREASARFAESKATELEARLSESRDAGRVDTLKERPTAETARVEPRTETTYSALRTRAVAARSIANTAHREAMLSRDRANQLAASQQNSPWRSVGAAELKPGDVLLVLGSSPAISGTITGFESRELGGEAPYSHASLFLGEINGRPMVAEMWSSGFWITPLEVSTRGARLVDAYRWEGIDDRKRREIAERGRNLFGPSDRFIRYDEPSFFTSFGSPLSYAFEEIAVLVAAVKGNDSALSSALKLADLLAGGRRKMICSELVAWVYEDVGLDLPVTYWKRFTQSGLLNNDNRRKDYTTPNMLARSSNLHVVGRYLGP
jgi:hypothetical protein